MMGMDFGSAGVGVKQEAVGAKQEKVGARQEKVGARQEKVGARQEEVGKVKKGHAYKFNLQKLINKDLELRSNYPRDRVSCEIMRPSAAAIRPIPFRIDGKWLHRVSFVTLESEMINL
ncbi:hypothetical protein K435DRAFT_839052 [Dendrothele bispora CBS 962.96]|uniref:Uncharacterized protein n=1 Tax=Dendrothele bispora (strain CBS 962.96) TaxID=1314807 RepID=A0A4S8M2N5_DENBC|nr:hypothetical protein K435DRAFT_839052 [Dendrothele bispora CBS 962.96]